jgi:transcriptional regulator with XRE-family HTH domain
MTKTSDTVDSIRQRLKEAAVDSDMSQQEIGEKMGMKDKDARKAVSRLLNAKVKYDPRLSSLLRFAEAIGKPLDELITYRKTATRKT